MWSTVRSISRRFLAPAVTATLALAPGCTSAGDNRLPPEARALLEGATTIELFALDPGSATPGGARPGEDRLHGFAILGRATLSDPAQCSKLAALVLRGIRESDGSVAACFIPRHGLRVERDQRTLELVICFECLSMKVYGDVLPAGSGPQNVLTAASVEPAVTALFESAGLTIAGR